MEKKDVEHLFIHVENRQIVQNRLRVDNFPNVNKVKPFFKKMDFMSQRI